VLYLQWLSQEYSLGYLVASAGLMLD
jgi:hypothetical protein